MMHHCKHSLLQMMAGIVAMLAITACQENNGMFTPTDYDKVADHTVLMYMVGDNNLSDLLEYNVVQAQKAMLDSVEVGSLNLLVFKDNKKTNDNKAKLYWVHRNAMQRLDTVMLKSWNAEVDAADPDLMVEVVKTAFSEFNTPIKGMVLASHASSWVPLLSNRSYGAPPRRAFGYDENTGGSAGSIELWDLGEALLSCPRLDYLIMDCCHMGTAEVAYELRDVAHYMVAGATETQGKGMPYLNVMTHLSQCRSSADLPKALDYAAQCYYGENAPYNGSNKLGATIALYDLSYMSQLADSYQQLLKSNASRLNSKAQDPDGVKASWAEQFQPYGREYVKGSSAVHYKYYFYDILDYIDWLSTVDAAATTAATSAKTALAKTVLKEYHSTQFWSEIVIDHSSGMGVTIPEVLTLAKSSAYSPYFKPFSYAKLSSAYQMTGWAKRMGY